jgi:hypothetical protein
VARYVLPGQAVSEHVDNALPVQTEQIEHIDFLPMCAFPPLVDDTAAARVLAFRDGPRGMLELRLGVPEGERAWQPALLGADYSPLDRSANFTFNRVHPHPHELLSPEHVYLATETDPASRRFPADVTPPVLPREDYRVSERRFHNLFWPFRLLADPVANRVRLLTHRGALWSLGGEPLRGLGEPCETSRDCSVGSCTREKVCCNASNCGGLCTTCKGSQPGICQAVPAGQPDLAGRCGSGECAGVCPGTLNATSCVFDSQRECGPAARCENAAFTPRAHCAADRAACVASAAPTPCANGFPCADATACRTGCTTRLDCRSRFDTCDVAAQRCVPDQVSVEIATRGITPAAFDPPALRTPQEIAAELLDAGYEQNDAGVIVLPSLGGGPIELGFDPNEKNPLIGLKECNVSILACVEEKGVFDECVAAAPRCVSETPWDGDPAGLGCCPEACLLAYFNARPAKRFSEAMKELNNGCYPGFLDYMRSE